VRRVDRSFTQQERTLFFLANLLLTPLVGGALWLAWRELSPRKAADAWNVTMWALSVYAVPVLGFLVSSALLQLLRAF